MKHKGLSCLVDHGGLPCPGYPAPQNQTDCNCSCHCRSGPCNTSHSHSCIHCTQNQTRGECECGIDNPGYNGIRMDIVCPKHDAPSKPTRGECGCCGGDIKIRNPKGYCDHLYYPENCNGKCTPSKPVEDWEVEFRKIIPSIELDDDDIQRLITFISDNFINKKELEGKVKKLHKDLIRAKKNGVYRESIGFNDACIQILGLIKEL